MLPTTYLDGGPLTTLTDDQRRQLAPLHGDPISLCRAAQGLLSPPLSADGVGLSPRRLAERNLRPASAILDAALSRDPRPFSEERAMQDRVTGTCRHFALLSCAFLRARRVPARARCGFATYFRAGLAVDHWVTEFWDGGAQRWVRVDSEILDLDVIDRPHDLQPGQFLTGPEAWSRYRQGVDPNTFGVDGTDHAWGVGEIIGNAIRDLAALTGVVMLPWDEWGPMSDCYQGRVAEWVEPFMDELSAADNADMEQIKALYAQVPVPDDMIVPDLGGGRDVWP